MENIVNTCIIRLPITNLFFKCLFSYYLLNFFSSNTHLKKNPELFVSVDRCHLPGNACYKILVFSIFVNQPWLFIEVIDSRPSLSPPRCDKKRTQRRARLKKRLENRTQTCENRRSAVRN